LAERAPCRADWATTDDKERIDLMPKKKTKQKSKEESAVLLLDVYENRLARQSVMSAKGKAGFVSSVKD
jgi:hypothetical protein